MYAVEFKTTVKEGVIKIPPQYISQLQAQCRVIILQDAPSGSSDARRSTKALFLKNAVQYRFDLPGEYTFNRGELYE